MNVQSLLFKNQIILPSFSKGEKDSKGKIGFMIIKSRSKNPKHNIFRGHTEGRRVSSPTRGILQQHFFLSLLDK